jgi:hypothetical protein
LRLVEELYDYDAEDIVVMLDTSHGLLVPTRVNLVRSTLTISNGFSATEHHLYDFDH